MQRIERIRVQHIPSKRIFDLLFSLSALLVFAPLYLLIILLIRATSKGDAFYSHERIGRGGRKFHCYKFRTMSHDAEAKLASLLQSCPHSRHEWEKTRKLKQDPRVTKLGHFLRKTSLDELPQFWNVIRGDLSVVGPRPVVESELAEHYGIKAEKILSIRPGLTGLWQVSGRNDVSYGARVQLDEKYVETRSIQMDLQLIAKTIPQMINRKGAY